MIDGLLKIRVMVVRCNVSNYLVKNKGRVVFLFFSWLLDDE